jgi:hypothetical protein
MTEDINMFERASREQTRFQYKGWLSVEDLWDLSVQELDQIFKGLNAKLKIAAEESLLGPKERPTEGLEFEISIVKHIVEVKLAEADLKKQESEKKIKIQKLLGALAAQQDAKLQKMSEEEIKKELEGLL